MPDVPSISWMEGAAFAAAMLVPFASYAALALWRRKRGKELLTEPDAQVAANELLSMSLRPRSGMHPGVVVAQAAMLYVAHGRFNDARRELARYPWDGRPGSVLCAVRIVEGLLALLEKGDAATAKAIFQEAVKLSEGTWPLFAMQSLRREPRAFVAIASLIEGRSADEDRVTVEAVFRRPPSTLTEAAAAWALAVDAYQRRDVETARRMIAHVHRIAPHCTPLHHLPDGVAA